LDVEVGRLLVELVLELFFPLLGDVFEFLSLGWAEVVIGGIVGAAVVLAGF
jgi:hypothetical protein